MKKLLPAVALFTLFTACKGKDEKNQDGATSTVTSTTEQATAPSPAPSTDSDNTVMTTAPAPSPLGAIPKFSDPAIQKYMEGYTAFANAYADAYKTKNVVKIQEVAMKASEWATRIAEMTIQITKHPAEVEQFTAYMAKVSNYMNAASGQ
jgi:hypothetical protein